MMEQLTIKKHKNARPTNPIIESNYLAGKTPLYKEDFINYIVSN